MFYKDILEQIFIYLGGKDILSCSIVCKDWNKASRNNLFWFRLLRRDLPKKIKPYPLLKSDPRFIYIEDINYKSLYLSYFDHHYQCGVSKYFNIPFQIENLGIYFCFTIGFPILIAIEIYDYYVSIRKKNHYCDCETCYQRSRKILQKYSTLIL
jgi:hypothetical protein